MAPAATTPVVTLRPTGAVRRRQRVEQVVKAGLLGTASVSVLTTVLIVFSLLQPTVEFFREVSVGAFFGGTDWAPNFQPASFGVWPIVGGTLVVTGIAVLVAVPCGLGVAFYLSEYARPRVRRVLKPVLELLAGIPTVVFGFFALTFVNPKLVDRFWPIGDVSTFSALGAGLVMGVMIVPIMTSLSEDAMSAVPESLRQAGVALGATRREVSTKVVFPAALSGIVAATVLAVSRAIGETMIALLAAGNRPNLSANPGEDMQTMTAYIGSTALGDIATQTIQYKTIFAVGALLFAVTFVLNIASARVVRRFRQAYE
ncbi:MAG: phosphate ABC transporter permease subunit PstC [Actinobacteria bacterium]|nr:phosphate ABC transporter permease subunit PstC [Actinomycetota bacterium]